MLFAAVPFKALRDAKSRLPERRRSELAIRMLRHVLLTLTDSHAFDRIAVVSPDAEVLLLASQHGAIPLIQTAGGLNEACELAAVWAERAGAHGLLVSHADLPRLHADDVRKLVAMTSRGRRVVLAPDRHGSGTNALLLWPPRVIPFAFGVDSRARHRALAHRANAPLHEFVSVGTSHDVDTADDLLEVSHLACGS